MVSVGGQGAQNRLLHLRRLPEVAVLHGASAIPCFLTPRHKNCSLTLGMMRAERIWDSTIDQIGFRTEKINIFSEVHESHYRSAYKMYLENKVIGIGVRNFRNFCHETKFQDSHKRSCTTHPHNTYVQILAELGLVGFIFLASLFFVFLYFCLKHLHGILLKKKYYFNDFEICLLAAILISIWPFIPTGNFFNNWLSITLYYPVGFLLWEFRNNEKIYLKSIKKKTFFSKFYFTNSY